MRFLSIVFFLIFILFIVTPSFASTNRLITDELEIVNETKLVMRFTRLSISIENQTHSDFGVINNFWGLNVVNAEFNDSKGNSFKLNKSINFDNSVTYTSPPVSFDLNIGEGYWYQTTFEIYKNLSNENGYYVLTNRFSEKGPFNEGKRILKIPYKVPMQVPIIINSIPYPDAMYDTGDYKILVWEIPEHNLDENQTSFLMTSVQFKYVQDNSKIFWDLFIAFLGAVIGAFLGIVFGNYFSKILQDK